MITAKNPGPGAQLPKRPASYVLGFALNLVVFSYLCL